MWKSNESIIKAFRKKNLYGFVGRTFPWNKSPWVFFTEFCGEIGLFV